MQSKDNALSKYDKYVYPAVLSINTAYLATLLTINILLVVNPSIKAIATLNRIAVILNSIVLLGLTYYVFCYAFYNNKTTQQESGENQSFSGNGQVLKRRNLSKRNIKRAGIVSATISCVMLTISMIVAITHGEGKVRGILNIVTISILLISNVLFFAGHCMKQTQQDKEDEKVQLNDTQNRLANVGYNLILISTAIALVHDICDLAIGKNLTSTIITLINMTLFTAGGVCIIASWHEWKVKPKGHVLGHGSDGPTNAKNHWANQQKPNTGSGDVNSKNGKQGTQVDFSSASPVVTITHSP